MQIGAHTCPLIIETRLLDLISWHREDIASLESKLTQFSPHMHSFSIGLDFIGI